MPNLLFNPPENVTDFIGFLNYTNGLTDIGSGGILGIGFLLVVFFGILLLTKAFSFERSFLPATLVTSIVALFLRILGLINDWMFYISILALILSIFMLFKANSEEGV